MRCRRLLTATLAAGVVAVAPPMAFAQPPLNDPFGGPPNAAERASYESGPPAATLGSPQFEGPAQTLRTDSPVVTGELFEPGEILATVGDQFVLAADVLPHVNQVLEQYKGKAPEEQLKAQRRVLIAQLTAAHVEVKILYLCFLRKAPAEQVPKILKKVEASFDKDLEEARRNVETLDKEKQAAFIRKDPQIARLALTMKEAGVWSPGELDALLRQYGGSLAQEKRYYAEYTLGKVIVHQNINRDPSVSYDEMIEYYEAHAQEYSFPERVRFEIMSVHFSRYRTRQEAEQAICAMGNEVVYGADFAAVARRSSQGLNADEGGRHDWTPRGTLASKSVEEALFALEPGKLSQIIEDERGLHIVRVIEHQEAGKIPFQEVQTTIREKIANEKFQKQYKDFVVDVKKGTKVWTTFDEDPLLSRAVGADRRKKR